jgi:hypothetical protein
MTVAGAELASILPWDGEGAARRLAQALGSSVRAMTAHKIVIRDKGGRFHYQTEGMDIVSPPEVDGTDGTEEPER